MLYTFFADKKRTKFFGLFFEKTLDFPSFFLAFSFKPNNISLQTKSKGNGRPAGYRTRITIKKLNKYEFLF